MKRIIPFLLIFISLQGFAQSKANINLLHNWQDASLPGSSAYNNTYNEVWGFVQNGREYGVIGSTMGTHIFDVTDPLNVVLVDFVPGAEQGTHIIHRDYHDYNGYLYMACDEGTNSTLQIADLQYLPDSVHVVYDSKALFSRAHNIFIDSATAKLYALSVKKGNGTSAAMSIYSLANPVDPVFLADWNAVGHVHDAYILNDTVFANAGGQGLHIMDFTTPTAPVTIGTLTSYPEQGYNHSGWLTEDRSTYIFTDENHGLRLKVCDATDLTDLSIESYLFSGVSSSSMAHNVIIKDTIAYVSYYHDGLYLFNISDIKNPTIMGWYDTYQPNDHISYRGAWGVYPLLPSGNILVSDMQTGLYVFSFDPTVGIGNKVENNGLNIFPNPFTSQININVPKEVSGKAGSIELFDITGRRVFNEQVQFSSSIHSLKIRENISEGVYVIKVTADNFVFNKKINKIGNR